jgi:hypothetical protein
MGITGVYNLERKITRRLRDEDLSASVQKKLIKKQEDLHDFIEEEIKIGIRERYMYWGERHKDGEYE